MVSYKTHGSFRFLKVGRWSIQAVKAKDSAPLKEATFSVGFDHLAVFGSSIFAFCGIASAFLVAFH